MNRIKNILILFAAGMPLLFSCQKDPLDEVNDGKWNKERNIIGITFNGQVGEAAITREGNTATISFTYNTATSSDFSAIKVDAIEISYGATASVKKGETLNFQNTSNSAVITVTPVNGEPLDWVVTLTPFTETLLGTWDIDGLIVYGGTGPEYGGTAVMEMTTKPWCWSTVDGPAVEEDNYLTFEMEGITSSGNTYGKIVNNAGPDGLYANFIYVNKDPKVDINKFYRKIPKGEGQWLRDYSAGTVTFTFADGTTTTGLFAGPGTEDLGNGKTKTIKNYAFEYALSGVDDWSNIYNDYDKFVSRPRRFWIEITKRQ